MIFFYLSKSSVDVAARSAAIFGAANASQSYSEIREVSVDSRMRLLSFHENHRPAYFGTFSRKSSLISGRRPFAKDSELLDYDYDSEAEWDEEEGAVGACLPIFPAYFFFNTLAFCCPPTYPQHKLDCTTHHHPKKKNDLPHYNIFLH